MFISSATQVCCCCCCTRKPRILFYYSCVRSRPKRRLGHWEAYILNYIIYLLVGIIYKDTVVFRTAATFSSSPSFFDVWCGEKCQTSSSSSSSSHDDRTPYNIKFVYIYIYIFYSIFVHDSFSGSNFSRRMRKSKKKKNYSTQTTYLGIIICKTTAPAL